MIDLDSEPPNSAIFAGLCRFDRADALFPLFVKNENLYSKRTISIRLDMSSLSGYHELDKAFMKSRVGWSEPKAAIVALLRHVEEKEIFHPLFGFDPVKERLYRLNDITTPDNPKGHLSSLERQRYIGGSLFSEGLLTPLCIVYCNPLNPLARKILSHVHRFLKEKPKQSCHL